MSQVRVEGLAELRRALRDAGDVDSLREFRDGLKRAADVVAQDARGRVPSRSGRAAGSVRALAGGNKAYVAGGKASVPYYGWLDFGSRSPRSGQSRSVGPWAGTGAGPRKGRFIYPAFEAKEARVNVLVGDALDTANRRLGF